MEFLFSSSLPCSPPLHSHIPASDSQFNSFAPQGACFSSPSSPGQQCGGVSPLLFVAEMSVTRALLLLCYLVAIRGSESSSPVGQEMRERIANGSVNILTTTIVPERVLIRRKRFLIFPKGSAIAVSFWSGPVKSITNCE